MEKQKFPREKFLWEPTQELVFVKYVGPPACYTG